MNTMDGTHYLSELIKKLCGNRNSSCYMGELTITAIVNGKEKVTEEPIDCQLMILHDSVNISIHWEDCGYKGYTDMGLFGRTNSKYFTLEELADNSFKITDNGNKNVTIFEW